MKRPTRVYSLLAPLVFSLTILPTAHIDAWEQTSAFVENAELQPVDKLTQSCPPPPPELCAHDNPVVDETCEVQETKELGVHGQNQYLVIKYLRSQTFQQAEGQDPYTCSADDVVLAALSGGGRAKIVWRKATERNFNIVSSIKSYSTPPGQAIISIRYCVKNTGNCSQEMLIWTGELWRELERDESWDRVYRELPAGYRPLESPAINLGNFTWKQHLAHENDPDCCPSGSIYFDLAIINNKLAVKSHRISVPERE